MTSRLPPLREGAQLHSVLVSRGLAAQAGRLTQPVTQRLALSADKQ